LGTCDKAPALTLLQNIAKAQKEIDKLEAETLTAASTNTNIGTKDNVRKPMQKSEGINGQGATSTTKHNANVNASSELAQNDVVNDVATELEKAKIDDEDES